MDKSANLALCYYEWMLCESFNKEVQKTEALVIFVYDTVFVLEETIIEIVIQIIVSVCSYFNSKEIAEFREILRLSIGSHADKLSVDDLNDLGTTLLQVTAITIKAKLK